MALVLLLILIAAEIGFLVFEAGRSSGKMEWSLRRLIVDLGQAVLFGIMLIFPGIDTGFRFKGIIIMLVARIAVAGIFALAYRKKTVTK